MYLFILRRLSVLVIVLMFVASLANAHAIVVSATPAQNAVVSGPNVPISLKFNSRIDAKRSRLTLATAGAEPQNLQIVESAPEDSLVSEAKGLKTGAYILRWQVLASDGHITRGEVPFNVK